MLWVDRIAFVDRNQWDILAHALKTPFLEWDWLHRMEHSESISLKTGWIPNHLTVWIGKRLVAAAPLYIKFHSEGEFIYDYTWVDVAWQLGIKYYPKMIGMSPVTPVTGYRFLVAPDIDETEVTVYMVREIDRFCREHKLSGCNFLFVDPDWKDLLKPVGFHHWVHQSFLWENKGFKSFDDYLFLFKSNQRRNIRREQEAMKKQNLVLKTYVSDEIPEDFSSIMYDFYVQTNNKFGPWGCKYLTRDFFAGLFESYRHRLLCVAAFKRPKWNTPEAMALIVNKGDQLYGRYWGCQQNFDSLHFNTCYYYPIQWAIENRIRHYYPGAGGLHKVRRGFKSIPSYCLLRFYDSKLQDIMIRHINRINYLEQKEIDRINSTLPFSSSR